MKAARCGPCASTKDWKASCHSAVSSGSISTALGSNMLVGMGELMASVRDDQMATPYSPIIKAACAFDAAKLTGRIQHKMPHERQYSADETGCNRPKDTGRAATRRLA